MANKEFIKELVESIFSIVGNYIYEGSESIEEDDNQLLSPVLDNMKKVIIGVLLKDDYVTESSNELITSLIKYEKENIIRNIREEETSIESLMILHQLYKLKRC